MREAHEKQGSARPRLRRPLHPHHHRHPSHPCSWTTYLGNLQSPRYVDREAGCFGSIPPSTGGHMSINPAPLKLEIILGSVREGRFGPTVGNWYLEQARPARRVRGWLSRPGRLHDSQRVRGASAQGRVRAPARSGRRGRHHHPRVQPQLSGVPEDRHRRGAEVRLDRQAGRLRLVWRHERWPASG